MPDSIHLTALLEKLDALVRGHILTVDFALQLALIGIALLAGVVVRKRLLPKIQGAIDKMSVHYRTKRAMLNVSRLIMQIVAVIVLVIGTRLIIAFPGGHMDVGLANAATSLLAAWIVIRLVLQFIENSAIRNLFAMTIWAIAALRILGILDETTAALDEIGLQIGQFHLSALTVIKGLIALFILLYAALFLSGFLERKVQSATSLTISSRVLISKIIRVTLVTFALLIGVTSAGIDLSLLAGFTAALGLGIGFGLQRGISNLFSGMMLLMDKSIKPGDVIELPGLEGESAFGWVEHMGARYTEIVTRDNKSYLIPNEDFITKQVVNWSHADTLIRVEVEFTVDFRHNPHEIIKIAEEAAAKPKRVCQDKPPGARLVAFVDNGLKFKLRFWIRDAEQGVTNMRSAVMLALWDAFQEHGISIPYPHREVYIHQPEGRKTSS